MQNNTFKGLLLWAALFLCAPAGAQNLLNNGDFESGLTGWTTWNAPPSAFWDDTWNHSNDCDIWVPTNGCPYAGTTSHAQKKGSGSGNAHGGLLQTISVTPGETYSVSGLWSGGTTGNLDGNNGTWWEINVFDGVPSEAQIDSGLGPQDVLIAKQEANNLASGGVFQFQWEAFSGSFTAASDTVTLVLKTGSFYTLAAAGYHDDLVVEAAAAAVAEPVPALPPMLLAALAALLGGAAFAGLARYKLSHGG
ncbi:hypothetical protein E4634_13355 [Mangrovimicrobium sediminis]|uniref:PEP-CTERM sorting domain-containing protein n=1 Tax=Mangrovimicrobium sediminis TaxID=2562682 RepID=A0A4Z0LZ61_9GAMM|nr:hypothetical protein [Haliea sp. SAOS-164]TGD72514.1 hypothetical protein E4634_13355 [Haliea sp. SAOS-164]